ncbi:Clp protease N-terminal domain-containing protein [Kribbella shirazensis]|uniref:ATP-dependent Clp protease ATP-binding subunit ClpA n=1 Tax=Kribbella shirazensis TaxID=1105143 RepID=A0A7X5ZZY4_9ACTN|nr:Clp protease N-terminal domain-containing protein [Kribbella shirazensis]NIK56646.1 ATP-dependent Clp protease ATP-binding subunit ClpA [Kribbella shirazensis]
MSDHKDVRAILVHAARDEARREGSRTIEAEHVLLALAAFEDSAAARLLADAGLTEDAIRTALEQEWEQSLAVAGVAVRAGLLPEATPDRERDPQIGESTKLMLRRAMDAEPKRARFGPMRVLVGLLATDRGRVARALEAAGVDRAALHAKATEALAAGTA